MSTDTPVQPIQEAPRTAAEISGRFDPSQDARSLLRKDLAPKAYFERLLESGVYKDAVRFTARWLSKREAVWWGCLCAWDRDRPDPDEKRDHALRAAVRWVLDPSEENRQAARTVGKTAGAGTPAGGVALAAFYSGGSMSYPDLPEVEPPEDLTAQTVAAAVNLAAHPERPSEKNDRLRQFLRLGLEVALGKNRGEQGPPK